MQQNSSNVRHSTREPQKILPYDYEVVYHPPYCISPGVIIFQRAKMLSPGVVYYLLLICTSSTYPSMPFFFRNLVRRKVILALHRPRFQSFSWREPQKWRLAPIAAVYSFVNHHRCRRRWVKVNAGLFATTPTYRRQVT